MKKIQSFALLCLFLIVWFFPSTAFACACCAERGHYSIRTGKPSAYQLEELGRLKFQNAELYTDAGYPESIKGISPLGESFTVDGLLSGKTWRFSFKDNNQKTGTLDLTKPLSMVEFTVDLPGANAGENPMVKLYKEWRFKYRVQTAAGIFKSGFAPATEYFLVLQGYGNLCASADDFTKWRLEISGRKSNFAYFGELSAAR